MIAETTLCLNPFYKPPYVTDGMKHGIPSRFMNHSREPNCRIFTISQNHADTRIYDIPFFTLQVIPAGTELTFDYKDEEDRTRITDEMAHNILSSPLGQNSHLTIRTKKIEHGSQMRWRTISLKHMGICERDGHTSSHPRWDRTHI